jgi:hypothetical protein
MNHAARNALAVVAAIGAALGAVGAAGCSNDPVYINPEIPVLEVNAGDMGAGQAMSVVLLPVVPETMDDLDERQRVADDLGVPLDSIPYVKLEDMAVSIEWTVRNLEDQEGIARVDMTGANEWFRYVPELFDLDVEDEEVQPPPPLVDGPPLIIPPNGTISGVIREDQIVEGAVDLELMGRAAYDPIVALLDVHEDTMEFLDMTSGVMIPRHLFAGFVELEMRFSATRHMVLEFSVRVRDHRGLLHDELGIGAQPGDLAEFAPVDLAPPAPDPPPA